MKIKTTEQIRRLRRTTLEFNSKPEKWAKINELIVWLQDTFGNADNVNLIVAELGRLKDED